MEKSLAEKVQFFENIMHAKISYIEDSVKNFSEDMSISKKNRLCIRAQTIDELLYDFEEIFNGYLYKEDL